MSAVTKRSFDDHPAEVTPAIHMFIFGCHLTYSMCKPFFEHCKTCLRLPTQRMGHGQTNEVGSGMKRHALAPVPPPDFVKWFEIFRGVNTMARQVIPPHFSEKRNERAPTPKNESWGNTKLRGSNSMNCPGNQRECVWWWIPAPCISLKNEGKFFHLIPFFFSYTAYGTYFSHPRSHPFSTPPPLTTLKNRYILEVELIEFAGGLHREVEGQAGVKNDFKHFGLSNWCQLLRRRGRNKNGCLKLYYIRS